MRRWARRPRAAAGIRKSAGRGFKSRPGSIKIAHLPPIEQMISGLSFAKTSPDSLGQFGIGRTGARAGPERGRLKSSDRRRSTGLTEFGIDERGHGDARPITPVLPYRTLRALTTPPGG
jgi:hypothetical protein